VLALAPWNRSAKENHPGAKTASENAA